MTTYSFTKMHGLGNDFVLIDLRETTLGLTPERVKILADRRFGIGCDQLIVLEKPRNPEAHVFMRIYNADGNEAGACGNGTRCIGSLISRERQSPNAVIETREGLLYSTLLDDGRVCVDMGKPRFEWQSIPLSQECDTANLPIEQGILSKPFGVSMGNPHMVFFVPHVDGVDVHNLGRILTKHPLYREGANVEIVEVLDDQTLKVRVYERGVGITMACGTGACASAVAAYHRGHVQKDCRVLLDGGSLDISYEDTVKITGTVAFTYQGTFDASLWTQQTPKNPVDLENTSTSSPSAAA